MKTTLVLIKVLLLLLYCMEWVKAQDNSSVPVIRIGRTFSATGFSSSEAGPITNGINFWYEWLKNTSNGGIWNKGTFYKVELIQFDDSSSVENVKFMYSAMHLVYNLTAVFTTWTQLLNGHILPITKGLNLPTVVTGAAGGQLYTGANSHMVGLLVNGAKRSLPCFQLFKSKGVKTAFILYNSDTFMTFVGGTIYPGQLASLGINVTYNTTFQKGATDFTAIIAQIKLLKPDMLALAQQENDLVPFLKQLRETLSDKEQPKAIMSANTTPLQVAYQKIGWQADLLYGGDQWSPSFQFTDPYFGTSAEFAQSYTNWLKKLNVTTTINFWDAASVQGGFVMQWALENTPSFGSEDMINTLRSVRFNETFFGPVSFLNTGEINSTGICQQLLPVGENVSFIDTTERELKVVYPLELANSEAFYPIILNRPPLPYFSGKRKIGIIVGVTLGVIIIIAFVVMISLWVFNKKWHLIFIPKQIDNDEWGSAPDT